MTLRTQGIDSTNAPPTPTMCEKSVNLNPRHRKQPSGTAFPTTLLMAINHHEYEGQVASVLSLGIRRLPGLPIFPLTITPHYGLYCNISINLKIKIRVKAYKIIKCHFLVTAH